MHPKREAVLDIATGVTLEQSKTATENHNLLENQYANHLKNGVGFCVAG